MTARTCDSCGHTGEGVWRCAFGNICSDAGACWLRRPLAERQYIEAGEWLDAHEEEYREGARNVAVGLGLVGALWLRGEAELRASEHRRVKPARWWARELMRAAGLWKDGE
jgi:hypothetical protein